MQIVILDGFTLNPGDLDWSDLETIGTLRVFDRTPPEQIVARAADSEIVLTNKVAFSEEIIEQLPAMRYIGILANPLLSARNCCITPHIAWATLAARRRLLSIATGQYSGLSSRDAAKRRGTWITVVQV